MRNNRLSGSVLKKYLCFLLTVGILIAAPGAGQFSDHINDKQVLDTSRNLIQPVIEMEPIAGMIEVPAQFRLFSAARQNNRCQNPLQYLFVVLFLCLTVSAQTYVMRIRRCRSDFSSSKRIVQFIHDQDGRK